MASEALLEGNFTMKKLNMGFHFCAQASYNALYYAEQTKNRKVEPNAKIYQ